MRDDKTEIFQAFESDLLQSEMTHQTALVALRKYLDEMADIASLTVVTMFEEHTDDGGSIVHLVDAIVSLQALLPSVEASPGCGDPAPGPPGKR